MKNKVLCFVMGFSFIFFPLNLSFYHGYASSVETLENTAQDRWIVVADSDRNLYKVKMDGTGKTKLYGPIGNPGDSMAYINISTNGKRVVGVLRNNEPRSFLYAIDLESQTEKIITSHDSPLWSGNISACGNYVCFFVNFNEPHFNEPHATICNFDGTNLRSLSASGQDQYSKTPTFSPDGKKIAYLREAKDFSGNYIYSLYVENIDGTGQKKISESSQDHHNPSFSFDGQNIYCIIGGELELYRINIATSSKVKISDQTRVWYVVQSKNGSRLVYLAMDSHGDNFIWSMSSDGTQKARITLPVGTTYVDIDVSTDGEYFIYRYSGASSGEKLCKYDGSFVQDLSEAIGITNVRGFSWYPIKIDPPPEEKSHFLPDVDGFRFQNFTCSADARTWEMFEQFYGTKSVFLDFYFGKKLVRFRRPLANAFFNNNYRRENGLCFGFTASVFLHYAKINQENAGRFAMPYYERLFDVDDVKRNESNEQSIYYYHNVQLGSALKTRYSQYMQKSPNDFFQEIKSSILRGNLMQIGIRRIENKQIIGHALLAYRVEEKPNEGLGNVYVYDSNAPGINDRFIKFNLRENSWSYRDSYFSEEKNPRMALVTANQLTQKGIPPWGLRNLLVIFDSNIVDYIFTDTYGRKYGFYHDKFYEEIPGVIDTSPEESAHDFSGARLSEIFIPGDINPTITMYGKMNEPINVASYGQDAMLRIDSTSTSNSSAETFQLNNEKREITYSSTSEEKKYTATIIKANEKSEISAQAHTNISNGETAKLILKDDNRWQFFNDGKEKKYDLRLEYVGDQPGFILMSEIDIDSNSTHYVSADNWEKLNTSRAIIQIDNNSDGIINEVISTPYPPSSLQGVLDSSYAKLYWNTSQDGTSPVVGYRVFRSVDGTNEFYSLASVSGRENTTYMDNTITEGESYLYYVLAQDQKGFFSPSSNIIALDYKTQKSSSIIIHLQIGNAIAHIEKEGKREQMSIDVPPQIIQERTLVPLRFIAEAFGSEVEWIASSKSIRIVLHDTIILMQIGNPMVYINDRQQRIDVPPTIRNERTLVPLRFIAEAFGSEVEWFPATKEIKITYQQK